MGMLKEFSGKSPVVEWSVAISELTLLRLVFQQALVAWLQITVLLTLEGAVRNVELHTSHCCCFLTSTQHRVSPLLCSYFDLLPVFSKCHFRHAVFKLIRQNCNFTKRLVKTSKRKLYFCTCFPR
jgi:hypothetical protein